MTTPVSTSVVLAVEELDGRDATTLPSLADSVDPDALDALFDPDRDGSRPPRGIEVSFTYDEYYVRVRGEGEVSVEPLDAQVD